MARQFTAGTADRLQASGVNLGIGGATNFTMSAWVYLASGTVGTILSKWDGTGNSAFIWDINGSKHRFIIQRAPEYGGSTWTAQSSANFPTGQWVHAMCVRTAADETHRLYMNGTLDGAFDLNGHPVGSNVAVAIGGRATGELLGGNMMIAEVAWWEEVLSTEQRAALVAGANPLTVGGTQLKAYWPLYGAGSDEPDYATGRTASVVGSLSQGSSHPPVARPQIWLPSAGF